jgi:hypothetical protein
MTFASLPPERPLLTRLKATKEKTSCNFWWFLTDGSAPPQLVANNTRPIVPIGRWTVILCVYIHAINEAASGDQIYLGSLTRRGILNAAGKIEIQTNADDLAGLLFDANNKVRCLSDGRIIFAAADLHLPCTALDMPQQPQLFALDPEREAGVIPLIPRSVQGSLPAKSDYYEPSPDGKRIAISGEKGAVVVLTLATGALDTVQAAGKGDTTTNNGNVTMTVTRDTVQVARNGDTVSVPAWRSAERIVLRFQHQRPAGASGPLEQRNEPGVERQLAAGSQKGIFGEMRILLPGLHEQTQFRLRGRGRSIFAGILSRMP